MQVLGARSFVRYVSCLRKVSQVHVPAALFVSVSHSTLPVYSGLAIKVFKVSSQQGL